LLPFDSALFDFAANFRLFDINIPKSLSISVFFNQSLQKWSVYCHSAPWDPYPVAAKLLLLFYNILFGHTVGYLRLQIWPHTTTNDHKWPHLTTSDHIWPNMTISDHSFLLFFLIFYFFWIIFIFFKRIWRVGLKRIVFQCILLRIRDKSCLIIDYYTSVACNKW